MAVFRVVTFNLWNEQGPHERRLELVAAGLAGLRPDAVLLQEVREAPGQVDNQAATLAARLGYGFACAPATPWGGGLELLGVLSRWPILESTSEELPRATTNERRVVLAARLASADGPLWVATTHLNYRLADGCSREEQVLAVDAFVGRLVSDLPRVLGGDFNATPEHDEIRFLRGLTTLGGRRTYYQDAYAVCHPGEAGHTWAQRNPYAVPHLVLNRRLDYIFVTPLCRDGRGEILACDIVLDQPQDGVYPSDHFGLVAEIRLSPRTSNNQQSEAPATSVQPATLPSP